MPGRIEYVPGDSLRDALRMAYGFTASALADSIELARTIPGATAITSTFLNGKAILAGTAPDVPLLSGDRIIVRSRTDLGGDERVRVRGEVKFPGIYPITDNRTRLSEIVAKAGGFTTSASIKRAELLRRSVAPEDIMMDRLESLRGGVSAEDSMYYSLETELRLERERVTVDFSRLFVDHDTTQDVRLRSEDEVFVPSKIQTIYVFGQVVSPGNVPFTPGLAVESYIKAAGGFTDRARKGDVKVVKGRTRQWLSPSETSVEEGDYVWVPKDPERPFAYYMTIIGQTAALISVAVSVAILAVQLNK
jgi:protein involved in polysaccharide export with SLBB domain